MTAIDPSLVHAFLQSHFHERVESVSFIGAGLFAQTFSFSVDQRALIFRLNTFEEDFQKDALAYQRFAAPALPIPRVVALGRFDDTYAFAITERCPGQTLNELEDAEVRDMVPRLFEVLDAIHRIDVSGYAGWGHTNADGEGRFASWTDYLLSLYDQKFAFSWSDLAQRTFLERDVYQTFLEAMRELLPYCPAEKYLVHGDFGFNNVISDGRAITAVLDWADMRLGDFVYDIAFLDYWSEEIPYGVLWSEYAAARRHTVPHFEERMRCYELHIGLGDMAICALRGNAEDYIWSRERARSALLPGRWGSASRAL